MKRKLDIWLILCTLFFTVPVTAQNLSWLRTDQTNNSSQPTGSSEFRQLAVDADGNLYTSIYYNGTISIGKEDAQVLVTSSLAEAVVVTKQNAAGDLIWYRNFDLLGSINQKMSINDKGELLIVGEVRGNYDTTFEGEPIQTDPLTDYLFYAWLTPDGSIERWKFTEEIFEDFRLERLADLRLMEDGSFWLAGGYTKEESGENFVRHDIAFVSLFDTDAKPIQRNHFDSGERVGEPTLWMIFGEFSLSDDSMYLYAEGNGFFGFSEGEEYGSSQHEFVLKINNSNTVDLALAVEDVDDNIEGFVAHEDGSFSITGIAEDGVLNTTLGDYDLGGIQGYFMANVAANTLNSIISVPPRMKPRKVLEDDNLVASAGWIIDDITLPDGHGGEITVTVTGQRDTFIAFYNKAGKVEYFDTFDTPGNMGSSLGMLPLVIGPCKDFYLGGTTLGLVDLDLSGSSSAFSNAQDRSVYFYAKYGNQKPDLFLEEEHSFCPGDEMIFSLHVTDELQSGISVSVVSPNSDFDPSEVVITGTGTSREVNLTDLNLTADALVTVRAEDACGAFTEKDVWIRLIPIPEAPKLSESGDYFLCPGDTLKLYADATYPLRWSNGTTADTLRVFAAGNYWAAQTPGGTCTGPNSDTLRVQMATLPEKPEVSPSDTLVICMGQSLTLTASLTERLVWSTGETSQSIQVTESGTYSVYQSSEHCGNSEASEVTVSVAELPPIPTITVVGDSRFCDGDQVLLRSSLSSGNLWSTGETTQEIVVTMAGSYSVAATVGNCTGPNSSTVEVIIDQPFDLYLPSDTTVCGLFEPLELVPEVSLAGLNFEWSNGATGSSLLVDTEGEYWVEVSNGACIERAYVRVQEVCLPLVYVPNAFTPNGDQENDNFGPVGDRVIDFKMIIYNQWGRTVFMSTDLTMGWDGMFEGKNAPAGKYVYKITYSGLIKGELLNFGKTGKLDLIR